jgi:hypothetical protein
MNASPISFEREPPLVADRRATAVLRGFLLLLVALFAFLPVAFLAIVFSRVGFDRFNSLPARAYPGELIQTRLKPWTGAAPKCPGAALGSYAPI